MLVIPAIDLLEGQVVRLKKGDYTQKTIYPIAPLEQAQRYKEAGFTRIHIVDLDGAKDGAFRNLNVIQEIAAKTGLEVQSGGGIRTYEHCIRLMDAGVKRIVSSSMAVLRPNDWLRVLQEYGGDACILGLDLKDGKMAYGGWMETEEVDLGDFIDPMMKAGLRTALCTDISRDGMLSGPNVALYQTLQSRFPEMQFIASGGVSSADDLRALDAAAVYGVVVGRAYYEGLVNLEDMKAIHHSRS